MKITTHTPDLLIVEDRPWLIGLAMTGFTLFIVVAGVATWADGNPVKGVFILLLAALAGGGGFWAFVRRSQAVFHRPEGWVELRSRTVTGPSRVRHKLSEIDAALVEDYSDSHRVVLRIPSGESEGRHPITPVYTSGSHHEAIAATINDWLRAGA